MMNFPKKSTLSVRICLKTQVLKGYVAFVRLFGIRTPPYMSAQKTFFCVKFPKTKPKTIFFSPKRLFQVFRFSTLEMSLCDLALFENAQNLRDKFWNLVCGNRDLGAKGAAFRL